MVRRLMGKSSADNISQPSSWAIIPSPCLSWQWFVRLTPQIRPFSTFHEASASHCPGAKTLLMQGTSDADWLRWALIGRLVATALCLTQSTGRDDCNDGCMLRTSWSSSFHEICFLSCWHARLLAGQEKGSYEETNRLFVCTADVTRRD